MLEKFKVLGCLMSLKIHLWICTWIFSPKSWCTEWEARRNFHQDIKEIERRHQSQRNVNMTGDCCWTLQHEIPETSHKRKSNKHSFASKRKRQYKTI
jgi:hypothetical protein